MTTSTGINVPAPTSAPASSLSPPTHSPSPPHDHATSPRRPSIPISAAQLNNTPAPLPDPPRSPSPPCRSPFGANSGSGSGSGSGSYFSGGAGGSQPQGINSGEMDSAYLDNAAEVEAPMHPTVAETGASPGAGHGPGPASGQLKRRESDAKRRIIRLASFGGEGLVAKPAVASEEEVGGSAIVD